MIEQVLVYGITISASLILVALGFSITFGISGIPNIAYGGFYILAGYISWQLIQNFGLPFIASALIAIGAIGVMGFLFYWIFLSRVRELPMSQFVLTFAMGIAITQALRTSGFYGENYSLPQFVRGGVEIIGVSVDYQRLFIIGVAAALFLFLYLFTHHARTGLSFRAVAQNERTAISLGIDTNWASALSVSIGTAIAAVAALTVLPLGVIDVNQEGDILLNAFAVCVIGGFEKVSGVIVGGLILGFAQIITSTFFGSKWTMLVTLVVIILILAIKPGGIIGQSKELEERV